MQAKIKELKQSLNTEFRLIHELCLFVLNASQKPDLIRATLATLHAYLSWVPLGYIFEFNIMDVLLKLFPQPPFRNVTLQCLTEVTPPCFTMHMNWYYSGRKRLLHLQPAYHSCEQFK